jgi:lipopolysaccharide transport system ATP-binding protein
MAIEFHDVQFPPLQGLSIAAPGGAIIGILGEKGSGETALLKLAAGLEHPVAGEIRAEGTRRYLGVTDSLNFAPVSVLSIDHTFATADALVRARALVGLDRLRVSGTTVLLASHERALLESISDEVWWFEAGKLVGRGDAREMLDAYHARIAEKFRAWGEKLSIPVAPSLRRGDGRAEIVRLETVGASGKPSAVLESGEAVAIRVAVRFRDAVRNPVIGMMIRTRIGLEVYGTNTDLEKAALGPCEAGETVRVEFRFACQLCPKEYTLTAASHDADGTAHDWLDDAVSFQVTGTRYTAGVANLRASVQVSRDALTAPA